MPTAKRPGYAGHVARRVAANAAAPGLLLLVFVLALALGGCAIRGSRPQPVDAPDRMALAALQAGGPARLAVGARHTGDAQPAADPMTQALRDALIRDFGAIGVLDDAARTRIDAAVLRSGNRAEALITVTRGGQTRLKKRYPVDAPVERSADPSTAIRPLLGLLYGDPEFALSIEP